MVALSCTKHIRFGGQEPLGQVNTSALDEMLEQIRLELADVRAMKQALTAQTIVREEHAETPLQLAEPPETGEETDQAQEETLPTEEQTSPVEGLFPGVSEAERNAVIEAYEQGIARRALCGHLHWGAGKYTTIVKPVLDAYESCQKQ